MIIFFQVKKLSTQPAIINPRIFTRFLLSMIGKAGWMKMKSVKGFVKA